MQPLRVTSGLAGWRVLVPRSGPWGERVANVLLDRGATPVIASLISYGRPGDPNSLDRALTRLGEGGFDWVMVTSATTADVLLAEQARVPTSTRVAAVGEATRLALVACGFDVAYTCPGAVSAAGLVAAWQESYGSPGPARILVLHSDLALSTVSDGLAALGHAVHAVVAYLTLSPDVDPAVVADVREGRVDAILMTSGSVAWSIVRKLAPLPPHLALASIGPRTTVEAEAAGLIVDVTAPVRGVESLIGALDEWARTAGARGTL